MKFDSGFPTPETDEDRADLHRRYKKLGLITLGLVVVALIIVKLVNHNWDAPAAPMPQTVTVMVPGRQPVDLAISTTGTLAARREMPVGVAGEGGMVARVLVEPGDWVAAGQTLAIIDRAVQTQQAGQLSAQINAARANAALAESELVRAQTLKERGFVSQADIDRKTATRDAARAQVRVAQAQLGEVNARIGRLDIRAPAAGLVLERKVEPGEVVSSGSGMLFRLAKGGEIELLARLAETDLARLTIGNSADVTPVGSARSFTGKVWQISPVIDPQTRQGVVRIALGYDPQLRPGGFATAKLVSGTASLPVVPESAVQGDAKASYVYIIGPNNKAERRSITIGTVSEKGVAITSGIDGHEQVVVLAGAFLNPGEEVMPVRLKGKGAGQ
jgi:RND family efflux transporter MFP subunit